MPNWIVNHLEIYPNKTDNVEEVIDFLKKYLTEVDDHVFFDFNKVIPSPDIWFDMLPREERFKSENQRVDLAWRRKHWGCKWNSLGNQLFDYDLIRKSKYHDLGTVDIIFKTAWNPPYPIIKKVLLDNHHLNITWNYYSYESNIGGVIGYENYKEHFIWEDKFKFKQQPEEKLWEKED